VNHTNKAAEPEEPYRLWFKQPFCSLDQTGRRVYARGWRRSSAASFPQLLALKLQTSWFWGLGL